MYSDFECKVSKFVAIVGLKWHKQATKTQQKKKETQNFEMW